jgi:hypothetical protein
MPDAKAKTDANENKLETDIKQNRSLMQTKTDTLLAEYQSEG